MNIGPVDRARPELSSSSAVGGSISLQCSMVVNPPPWLPSAPGAALQEALGAEFSEYRAASRVWKLKA